MTMRGILAAALTLSLAGVVATGCGDDPLPAPLDVPQADTGTSLPGDAGDVAVVDTGTPPGDTGVTPMDSSVTPMDTGVVDSGGPPVDTGGQPTDTGVTPMDTGSTPVDTGFAVDTGVRPDTGFAVDTGFAADTGFAVDTGFAADTGTGVVDTGVYVPPDAGPSMCPEMVTDTITLPRTTPYTRDDSTSGTSGVPSASCRMSTTGGEDLYTIVVSATTDVEFSTAESTRTTYDSVLSLRRICTDLSSEIACNDDTTDGTRRSRFRTTLMPGTYSLIVDGFSSSGPYNLVVRSFTGVMNSVCATPQPLTLGVPASGDTSLGGSTDGVPCSFVTESMGPIYFTVPIPAGRTATVVVTPSGTPAWRVGIRRITSCSLVAGCPDIAEAPAPGTPVTLNVRNSGSSELSFLLAVASDSARVGGPFQIVATLAP